MLSPYRYAMARLVIAFGVFLSCGLMTSCRSSSWSDWWTHEGISGPDFWGLVNPEWSLCHRGQHQSPINIEPERLLYDPHLPALRVDRQKVDGTMVNTGHDVKLVIDDIINYPSAGYVNISGGPLSYQYRVHELSLHFGRNNTLGSEHTIARRRFPAELQILAYNTDLYGNISQAIYSTHGLAIIAILAQISHVPNEEFDHIARHLRDVKYKGQEKRIHNARVENLLPVTSDYVTYEGSLTQPGCQETVTWILLNKPLYITQEHMSLLRSVMQGDVNNPKVAMENNFRPTQPINQRPVRTNINFFNTSAGCPTDTVIYYKANVPEKS